MIKTSSQNDPKMVQNHIQIITKSYQNHLNNPKSSLGGTGIRSPDFLVPSRVLYHSATGASPVCWSL